MIFRTSGAIAALLIGLVGPGGQALAQYYPPPPQVYPPPPGYRPLAPVADAEDNAPFYDPPMIQSRPLPPVSIAPQGTEPLPPPGAQYGRAGAIEEAELPPPGGVYREPPPGYVPLDPGVRVARPYYGAPPDAGVPPQAPQGQIPQGQIPQGAGLQGQVPQDQVPQDQVPQGQVPQGFEPAAAGSRPYYPGGLRQPDSSQQDAMRPPMPIGPGQAVAPGQVDPGATGSVQQRFAALPPDVRPETGPTKELPAQFRRTLVDYRTKEPAGTIIIDTPNTYLYLVLGNGQAMRYGVGVGREGFTWNGAEKVTRMAEWPDWHPPEEMIERQPYLPRFMAGGPGNPLGARALYLGKTVYRIHGTNQPSTIGTFVSSGCIRLTNEDVQDLYTRVKVGTRVVVLPGGKQPATASAMPVGAQYGSQYGAPPVSMAPPGPLPGYIGR
jgi:lipoprotein-anchoring transpeptidase ErfK/SrfK